MESVTHFIDLIVAKPTGALLVTIAVLFAYTLYLDRKITVFTRGQSGASLEEIIKTCLTQATKIEERNEFISKHALTLEEKVSHSLRNAQTIRYKAFDTNGSNQSFSVALVNEKGNGVVISSFHAHERISTFAKPIENYESTYELTEEELAILADAKKAHKISL